MEIVSKKEKIPEGNNEFNDKASGVYNFADAIGCLFAPIIGGVLFDSVGFRYMCDVMAFLSFSLGLLLFLTIIRSCKCASEPDTHEEQLNKQNLLLETKEEKAMTDEIHQEDQLSKVTTKRQIF